MTTPHQPQPNTDGWNHDISKAPRGRTVLVNRLVPDRNSVSGRSLKPVEEFKSDFILAVHPDGIVAQSYWIPARYTQSGNLLDGNRWSGFNVGRDPIAWAPWPIYEIHESPSNNDKACSKVVPQDNPSPAGIGSELPAGREGRNEGEAASADLPTQSQTGRQSDV